MRPDNLSPVLEPALAFAEDLEQLAFLHSREPSLQLLLRLRELRFPRCLGVELVSAQGISALRRLEEGLQNLPPVPDKSVLDVLAADYADIYLSHTFGASPFESVWIDDDRLALQEPTFQVRRICRMYGLEAANWRSVSEDHLVAELELLSHILKRGGAEDLKAAAAFLDEHLLRWSGDFFAIVNERAATVFFSALAELSSCYLEELRAYLELATGVKRPAKSEIEKRLKPRRAVCPAAAAFAPGCGPTV